MIIESPGKIAKLESILGPDWRVAASVGHVRDLPLKEIGVEAPEFRPKYVLTERGGDVVQRLQRLVQSADEVYLATDPDREGESISWHLQQVLKLANPLRVTFNEITPAAVRTAISKPGRIDVQRVAAQEARRVLDRLVGYLVSPELSNQTGQNLSAGRVQSPAVRLVVERERQIRAFRSTDHFGVRLAFADAKTEWAAEWVTLVSDPNLQAQGFGSFVEEDFPYFLDRGVAAAVSETTAVQVLDFTEAVERRAPPAPFTTSTLQQAASVALGLDPKATMSAAQRLYEEGHITYHRTDNPNLSEESLPHIEAEARKLGLMMVPQMRRFKAPEGAQAGHPAITPTHFELESIEGPEDLRRLYQLIRLRAIACQLADAEYQARTALLKGDSPIDGKEVLFQAKGRVLNSAGWLHMIPGDQTEESADSDKAEPPIPVLTVGQSIEVSDGVLLEKKTRAPKRFTQASLVKRLESEGIGRPATYAAIMTNIIDRGYVAVEKKYLVPTPSGELIFDSLSGRFEFMDLGWTRDVESELDKVADGKAAYRSVVSRVYDRLKHDIAGLEVWGVAPRFPCPSCQKAMRRIKGKSGYFWGCSGHPDCSTTLPDEKGKPGKRVEASTEFQCPQCQKPLIRRQKKGKGGYDFWGCTGFKEGCKATYETKNNRPAL